MKPNNRIFGKKPSQRPNRRHEIGEKQFARMMVIGDCDHTLTSRESDAVIANVGEMIETTPMGGMTRIVQTEDGRYMFMATQGKEAVVWMFYRSGAAEAMASARDFFVRTKSPKTMIGATERAQMMIEQFENAMFLPLESVLDRGRGVIGGTIVENL